MISYMYKNTSIPEKKMPMDIGVIHFVGIGGIGMSGIAEILHNLGYQVTGSDISNNANTQRLTKLGIKIFTGHDAENVSDVAVVVKSTAVPLTNPEILEARKNQIPVVRRSEMLAELTHLKATIAVAGSHGKTTTTSLVGHMLVAANMDPTVINGGIINTYGTNVHLGEGDWIVTEADESDGTFIRIPATIGIVTNLDPEHLDYWNNYDSLVDGFKSFIQNLPFYGSAILCFDHPKLRELSANIQDRRIISYAIDNKDADIIATNIRFDAEGSHFDIEILRNPLNEKVRIIKDIFLPIHGKHNILNSLAAVGVAIELKLSDETIAKALRDFSGVKRRFTKIAEINDITIIDDYAHHPVEIKATLSAAKNVTKCANKNGKVIAVMQPHRYSRLESLFVEFVECFKDADKVIITDIYAAGEQPIEGVNKTTLVEAIENSGIEAHALDNNENLVSLVKEITSANDIVVCMGAGNITQMASKLADKLSGDSKSKGNLCVVS